MDASGTVRFTVLARPDRLIRAKRTLNQFAGVPTVGGGIGTAEAGLAVTHPRKAALLTPGKGIVRYHLAKALLAAGRKVELAAGFRAALEHPLPGGIRQDATQGAGEQNIVRL